MKLTFFLGWFSFQDRFISGAVLLGVEQHEVAARGAFDPDGEGQIAIVILAGEEIIPGGGTLPSSESAGKRPMPSPSAEPQMRQPLTAARSKTGTGALLWLRPATRMLTCPPPRRTQAVRFSRLPYAHSP